MKNWPKNLGVTFLIAIYCFASFSATGASQFILSSNTSGTQKEIFANAEKQFAVPVNIKENRLSQVTEPESDHGQDVFIFSAFDHEIQVVSVGYEYYSRHILINHRKSDLIFPFHYFW